MTKMARFKNGLSVSRKLPLLLPVRHLKQERRGERLRATVYSPVFLSVKTPRAWHPRTASQGWIKDLSYTPKNFLTCSLSSVPGNKL